ncbi:hypothetical protein EDC02_5913 [Micromonospora sp. Llam0]|uniref:hypothetical protein n=1 Tax=Micromonospora sp. Llam0 TaxID=2485143 RepID=UPI000FBC599C|nr:hypothetical protein [Micromonospora sp. Llam0]ROO51049.1 hypothetical protein EDC02_5913 [Micromonospora sp. Llam0]
MTTGISDTDLQALIGRLTAGTTTPHAPAPVKRPHPCDDMFCSGTAQACGWSAVEHMAGSTGGASMAAPAPAKPVGPPPATIGELRPVLVDYENSRPRSMQVALGPSELGTPCQQQIARKLVGAPRRPITAPAWAPFQGTAVHRSMEEVVAFWNQQLGRERWLAEDRLLVDPGMDGVDPVEGNGDAFDTDHDMVVDWKHTGKTAREKLLRAQRMRKPPAEQVSPEYRVQGHLYGYGHAKKGRPVRWVRLVLLARSHNFDESAEWTEAYNPDIAIAAIDRYYATHDLIGALGGKTNIGDLVAAVPATPNRDTCKWCPFLRPDQPANWGGCPGDRTTEKVTATTMAGLIA